MSNENDKPGSGRVTDPVQVDEMKRFAPPWARQAMERRFKQSNDSKSGREDSANSIKGTLRSEVKKNTKRK